MPSVEATLKYRRKHFALRVRPLPDCQRLQGEEGCALELTGNGYQWSSVMLLDSEVDEAISALQAYKQEKAKAKRKARLNRALGQSNGITRRLT